MELLKLRIDINPRTPWRKVQEELATNTVFTNLNKLDRIAVFEDYVREAEKAETEERHRERDRLRREVRCRRVL